MVYGLDNNSAFDAYRKAFAPVTEATDAVVKSFEKVARFEVDAAVAQVQHVAARINASIQARNPVEFAARQTELTAQYLQTCAAQWQDFLKSSADLQNIVIKFASDSKPAASDSRSTGPAQKAG